MRKLIRFIEKNSFFFLFLMFEVFAFYLLLKENSFQRTTFYNNINVINNQLHNQFSNLTDYLNLKEVNLELAEENRRLREQQLRSFKKLNTGNFLINDTIYQQKYLYTKGKIINNSTNKQNNYITLNIGSKDGIEESMGVVSSTGIVGIVKSVSHNFSTALSILHSSIRISVKLKTNDSYGIFGSLHWDGKNYQQGLVTDIPNHVFIEKGDTIVTSGFSAIFPEGITVGTIERFEKPKGENFYKIRINFTTNFKNISHVYVIKNIQKNEQKELEVKDK